MYRKPHKIYRNRWLEKLTIIYHDHIKVIIDKPKAVFYTLGLILAASVIMTFTVGKDFLPQLDEGSIWLQVQLPPGISLEKSKVMSDTLRKRILRYSEVTYVLSQTGRDDAGSEPFSTSHVECSVGLKPYKEWPRGKTKSDLIDEMAADLNTLPGYRIGFSQPIIDMVMDLLAGTHSDLALNIYGDDFKESRQLAEKLWMSLFNPGLPMWQLIRTTCSSIAAHADRDKIAQYGLNVSDVAELIEVAIGGKAISQVYISDKVYDVICRYTEEPNNPEKIATFAYIRSGAKIPLHK